MKTTLLVALPILLFSSAVEAKDLRNRPGIGFNNQFGQISALSFRYGFPMPDPAINLQGELAVGFAADSDVSTQNSFFAGARLLYALVVEDNMNLYAAAGGGVVSSTERTAAILQPGLGVEFFFFGLENLGVAAEWGVNIDLGSPTGVATYSGAPGVGLHYYF